MLLTPTSDNRSSTATGPVPGATTVIEADTAEEALGLIHERLGATARILEARRVRRGGIGGFFAREVVQMHAAPSEEPSSPGAGAPAHEDDGVLSPPDDAGDERPQAGAAPIDRLLAQAEETSDVVNFATFLREQLGRDGEATPAQTAEHESWPPAAVSHVEAQQVPAAAPDMGEPGPPGDDDAPRWSTTTLIRLGLPGALVRSMEIDDAADDLAWTTALATALRSLCRPLPTGRALLVGPCARGLARQLGTPVARIGEPLNKGGDVAAALAGGAAGLDWLQRARRGRWLHLVAGGKGWRPLLHEDPLAISWATAEDLPEVIRLASELGLVLGYGPLHDGIGRARPLEVALAVRALVPRP